MPAVLTHKAIMLLARERLATIRAQLRAKVAGGRNVSDLEHRVLHLAEAAHAMLSVPPHPSTALPGLPYFTPLGQDVSKFAVMGAMGPDIPAFAALFDPGQSWVFDNVHKGYPATDREAVMAETCEFALALWRHVERSGADAATRDRLRAYVLGHLCHVAGDVVSHPYVNDIEWHQGLVGREKFSHEGAEGPLDAKVARQVLLRASTREGEAWEAWWPTLDEVPPMLFDAWAEALEQVYSARSRRRTGFAEFEEHLAALGPPVADAAFIRDGYGFYREAVIEVGYRYGYWRWWAVLLPLFLVALALPPLAAYALRSRQLFHAPKPDDDLERATFEFVTLPFAAASPLALGYGAWVASLSTRGVEKRAGAGIGLAIVAVLDAIAFFVTLAFEPPGWVRWLLLFGIPAAIGLGFTIPALVDLGRDGHGARGGLTLMFGLPLALAAAFLLWFGVFLALPNNAGGAEGRDDVDLPFGFLYGVWAIACLVLHFVLPPKLRDVRIPEQPVPFPADFNHHVRLFDDATLFLDPGVPARGAAGGFAQRFYPSGRRKLLKLWWEGEGTLSLRPDRFQLVFRLEGQPEQVVAAPIAPMRAQEYARLLERSVRDAGGTAGKLKAALVYPADPDYELPAGASFADHGDDQATQADHDAKAAEFRAIGTSADDAYLLFHAPKAAQAIRFGRRGPVAQPFDQSEAALAAIEADNGANPGYAYVHDPAAGAGGTLMDLAADLAALLCLGGASHMLGGATTVSPPERIATTVGSLAGRQLVQPDGSAVAADPALAKVHQVFRNWNLDRRRVNEWRMLLAGGAVSEKGGAPDRADSLMLRPLDPEGWRAPLSSAGIDAVAEGEATARTLGWVPLLRAWLDLARRPGADPLSPEPLDPNLPGNRALSRGIAFLLDLPDPRPVR